MTTEIAQLRETANASAADVLEERLISMGRSGEEARAHAESIRSGMAALREDFLVSRRDADRRAMWSAADDDVRVYACRYCGRYWQRWSGHRMDGHVSCVVDDGFKNRLGEFLRSPLVTYALAAEALGVTPGIVRSWAFSAGVTGPVHPAR